MGQKYAILSDIHGNRWALEVVLSDIEARGIRRLLNLGDFYYGPLDPKGTSELLKQYRMDTVLGNGERILYEATDANSPYLSLPFVLGQLTGKEVDLIRQLPLTRIIDREILICHGTPAHDSEYLLEGVQEHGVTLRSTPEIEADLAGISCPVVACGHSHVAKTVWLPDGRMVVNAGSIGLPAYSMDSPRYHVMECGSPHASYTIVDKGKRGWNIEHVRLSYDWEKAARQAEGNGRRDWAQWLETGRA
ncbi:MAG: metallophosphatase family protein [Candidatus Aminicenantes bacterium]|nr:metallophosphatase family protein [Candidatus Aminicenantes bacterium]